MFFFALEAKFGGKGLLSFCVVLNMKCAFSSCSGMSFSRSIF